MTDKCMKTRDNYWLVIDKTITPEQLISYKNHLEACLDCRKYIAEFSEIDKDLSLIPVYDLNESRYRNMISKLPTRRTWFSAERSKRSLSERKYVRYVFTGAVFIMTIALLLFFNSEKPLKKISKPVISLDWKAEKIENKIQNIDSSLVIIRTKDVRTYFVQENPWKSDVYLLARDIERMQTELDKSTL